MKYKINIVMFFSILSAISILNMLSPKDRAVSEAENRALAGRPEVSAESILTGKFSMDFENYFADQFLGREKLAASGKNLSSLRGIKRTQEVSLVDFEGQNAGGNTDENDVSTNGNLLILDDTVMEIYKFDEAKSKQYADMISTLENMLEDDVKIYSLLAPVQIEFLSEKIYKDLSDSQLDGIGFVNSNLSGDVIPVDAYHPIHDHIDEYVYFRTDHHWTALGAYYGYTGFAKAAGFEPIPLDKYTKGEAPGFLGYLSKAAPSEKVNGNPDNIVFYEPPVHSDMDIYFYDKESGEKKSYKGSVINKSYAEGNLKYGIFLGGDFPLGIIKTNANTGKKTLVIKDSYGNAFIPFLLPHYSEIYVVDPRHYKESIVALVQANTIDEVLFLNYILTTNFTGYIDSALKLMK